MSVKTVLTIVMSMQTAQTLREAIHVPATSLFTITEQHA